MKIILSTTLCIALAVTSASFVAPAFAQSALALESGISVILIRDNYGYDEYQEVSPIYRHPSARTLAKAQEEIRTNPAIRALLQRRGISFRNVVGVQTALNGGKVVYVR
ncbi:hypothetical protein [Pararhizobium gei]|uniref:hypothetical protein n=1 Tax=Pararhizobium gei TaxID=1395951 RepID=UPI0023D9BAC1|nr:hypothetical protein [Rhizobium gei]